MTENNSIYLKRKPKNTFYSSVSDCSCGAYSASECGCSTAVWEKAEDPYKLDSLQSEYDPVSKPEHYNNKSIEVIDYIDDTVPDFYSYYFGNAIKYLSRHMHKGSEIQDLEKCKWYIDRMIEDWK